MQRNHGSTGIRHRLPDRLFHWFMAAAVVTLGASAFLPILGLRFDWVPLHWIAGVALTLAIAFHVWRVLAVHGIREMVPDSDDLREVAHGLRNSGHEGLRPAKYDALQKAYHAIAALTVLVLTATGLLMLAKIDTTFWRRDPSILSDQSWGVVYVLHGAASMLLLFLFIVHVYFALIPEHREYLRSMISGAGPENARGTRR